MPKPKIKIPAAQITEFCRRNRIRHLSLFGSVLRDDFRPDSDVDVLVEFEPGALIGMMALGEMREELDALLKRPVDLVLRVGLKPVIRDSVLKSEQVIYAA